ncbi:MAG: YeiH family protein [Pseudonocardiaceae bacterium]
MRVGPATTVTPEVTSGPTAVESATPTAVEEGRWRIAPGLLLALVVAVVATMLGRLAPIVGGPVFGILIGVVAAAVIPALRAPRWKPGCTVASKQVLQLSIVVLGAGLSLQQVVAVGRQSLPVMLGTLAVALGGAWVLSRLLNVRGDTQILIGVGTGICGASAIAATTAVIKAKDCDVAYAIGTIFTFNIAAVLHFPPIGHLLGMSPQAFGLWSGTAINDTSSVVAAAYTYGGDAGAAGIVVKLTLPLFLVGFILAAGLDSLGLVPSSWRPVLSVLGTFLITTALAGIGLSLRSADMRKAGRRPLLLGALLWVTVATSSLGLQALTGTF